MSPEKKDNSIVVLIDDEMKAGQVNDMLVTHFVRRKVDPLCLKKKELEISRLLQMVFFILRV